MDPKQIKDLLEKYYKAETSSEEEKTLKKFFMGDHCDDEFLADRDIFLYHLNDDEALQNLPDITDELWEGIVNSDVRVIQTDRKKLYWTLRIAAGIAILISSFFLIKDQLEFNENDYKIVDTYETPQEAYEQAKETLLYVSALLNSGTNHLEPIEKLNEGTQKLEPISMFHEGLKGLNQVSKYQKAEKYIKQ